MAKNNFVPLLKGFIANVLKCKAHLKAKINLCVHYYVFLSAESQGNYLKLCAATLYKC